MFPDDIDDFPLECKVEFAIDLVPVSMDSYRMSALKLSGLKKQLEELLVKKNSTECFFVGSVSVVGQEEGW